MAFAAAIPSHIINISYKICSNVLFGEVQVKCIKMPLFYYEEYDYSYEYCASFNELFKG
jgi:hypothetical protein